MDGQSLRQLSSFFYRQSSKHEIDFVAFNTFYEIKTGKTSPSEFLWFPKTFPDKHLFIVSSAQFETSFCTGITMEDFLLERY